MATWGEVELAAPELAAAVRARFVGFEYQINRQFRRAVTGCALPPSITRVKEAATSVAVMWIRQVQPASVFCTRGLALARST